MSSRSDEQEPFYRRYTGAIVSAFVIGLISLFAIATSPQYGDIGTRIANGVGAGLTFGAIAFTIGYAITKIMRRRRPPLSRSTATAESPSPPRPNGQPAYWPPPANGPVDHPVVGARAYVLSLDQLHPVVRAAADRHWPYGNYTSAVDDTARAVNAAIQAKAGVYNLTEGDLVAHLYSDKPAKSGEVRLHFPQNQNSRTLTSRTNGAKYLGMACYAGIRNIVAHQHRPDWTREDAFEYLAMFSVLMRWVTECEVERIP